MTEYDYGYEDLGLVAGLEIHQQFDTETKLFCGCPTDLRRPDEATRTFTCFLHPTKSKLGELDDATLEESRVEREFEYLAYDSTCLVEEDDEPPYEPDHEVWTAATQIAELLNMNVVDEAHVMHKLVIDGSNAPGLRRLSLIAQEGEIQTEDDPVSVVDLMLEEGSAQRVEGRDDGVLYSLDRLGIPLVEIGTGPDISSPEQAREAAQTIGMFLRSTGRVKRSLGAIRQDVNVSIADGACAEIKDVQALDQIDGIVRFEVGRQAELVEIRDELQSRNASVGDVAGVTDVFEDSDSGVIRGALDAGGKVTAAPLYGFDGLVGRELQPDSRLDTELPDHAKHHGAGGILHTDELPAYDVTEAEVESLREAVGAGPEDVVAIVADDPEAADLAIDAVAERAEVAIEEVPEETRGANDDGTARYLRPLPGAARIYPETGVLPVDLDPSDMETPEFLTEKVDCYQAEFGLDAGLVEQVVHGRTMLLFKEAVDAGIDAMFAAGPLESTLTELRRDDVAVSELVDNHPPAVMQLVENGDPVKEGVNDVLTIIAEDPSLTTEEAAEKAGLSGVSEEEVREVIAEVVECNADQVEQQDMGAFSALMGEAMGALRGKADGGVVSDVLRGGIQKWA